MKGVKFGKYHSYDDFGLVLTKIEIGIPEAKTSSVDIEGADGLIDTTNALTEITHYKNRSLQFTFEKINDGIWYNKYLQSGTNLAKVVNVLHGKKMEIILDDDPSFYYMGRVSLTANSSRKIDSLVVSCDCVPYKYNITESVFNLNITEGATQTLSFYYSGTKPVCPTLNVYRKNLAKFETLPTSETNYFTYTSNVADNITCTQNEASGRFMAAFSAYLEADKLYFLSSEASELIRIFIYKDKLRGTNVHACNTSTNSIKVEEDGHYVFGLYRSSSEEIGVELSVKNFMIAIQDNLEYEAYYDGAATIELTLDNKIYLLSEGKNIVPDFILENGQNSLNAKNVGGAPYLEMKYREGVL